MLTAEEKWELYYKKAVALQNDNRSVWDEFFEASRVLKLSCHKDALEHLRHFNREGVSNLEFTRCLHWKFVSSYILSNCLREKDISNLIDNLVPRACDPLVEEREALGIIHLIIASDWSLE